MRERGERTGENGDELKTSVYPITPTGSKVLLRFSGDDLTYHDRLVVLGSSLFFVGGVMWVPCLYGWMIQRFKAIPKDQKQRRALYAAALFSLTALYLVGPHRHPRVGEWVKVHRWALWKSWMRFFAFEVVADNFDSVKDLLVDSKQAILGISPHGVFPFGLAFAALSEQSAIVFGRFRAVVATATYLLPWVRDVLRWVRAVDASRPSVDRALEEGARIGLAPGGIAEMLQDANKRKEYAIIRKGIFRLAAKHRVPVIPIYCFGSSMLLKRMRLPVVVEKLGLMLRMSLVVFFGQWGLPVPFRQRLLYVMGKPIHPSQQGDLSMDQQVDSMYKEYCSELLRIFDRHKESYAAGWGEKTLKILTERS